MPMNRLLEESRSFDPTAVGILLEALEAVVAELRLRSLAEQEKAARVIIRLAERKSDFDAATLRDCAINIMLNESGSTLRA